MNFNLLYQWSEELASYLPSLNSWQIANIALFSIGVIRAEHCQQDQIARQSTCGEKVASTSRRWRRFLANTRFPLQAFFREWSAWMLRRCESDTFYLLVDETKLQDRFSIMMLGLAWEGRCIPLAWRCWVANDKEQSPIEGQVGVIEKLLQVIAPSVPTDKRVILLADRGIGTSPALCRVVQGLHWYFLFRVTSQSKICTNDGEYTIAKTVQQGEIWSAEGLVFKQRGRIPAGARAIWSDGYDDPWALVTNDPTLEGYEYAIRNWQEQSFRDLKSHGWQWSDTRIRKVDHLERLLVVLVVAYMWMIALGCYAVHMDHATRLVQDSNQQFRRRWSLFKEGLQFFTDYLWKTGVCLTPCFVPDKRFT